MYSLPSSWMRLALLLAMVFVMALVFMLHLNTTIREEVDGVRSSLLECKEEAMGVREKCLYEYNLTLSFTSTMGRTVMLDRGGVELMCSVMGPGVRVLEYGSGGSTTFFSQFVDQWVSMEHDTNWAPKVRSVLPTLPWSDKVRLLVVPRDLPTESFEGTPEEYRSYIDKPAELAIQFHLVIDDGRARVGVGQGVVDHKLLAPGGRMIIHDWERKEYKKLVSEVGFMVDREDTKSKRQMALLKLD